MAYTLEGIKMCPDCGGESFVDMWKPPPGIDQAMRKFMCSCCPGEFYMVIEDKKLLKYLDKQVKGE